MPARRRRHPGGVDPTPDLSTRTGRRTAQHDAAKVFADRQVADKQEQRERSRVQREAAAREKQRRELSEAKDAAARRLKDVRRRGASAEARAEVEAAYRAALDAVLRDEQGLPPADDAPTEVAAPAPADDPPTDPTAP